MKTPIHAKLLALGLLALVSPCEKCVGPIPASVAAQVVRMIVVKCGGRIGVTEGEAVAVEADRLKIELLNGTHTRTELSACWDSNALWLEQVSRRPVGLHYQGNTRGLPFACARPADQVMAWLGLAMA